MGTKQSNENTANNATNKAPNIPSGGANYLDLIQGKVIDLTNTLAMMQASVYVGKADDGKDVKTAQSKAKANKTSILGSSNSIYSLLKNINEQVTSKKRNQFYKNAESNLKDINKNIKTALLVDNGKESLLGTISEGYINNGTALMELSNTLKENQENLFKVIKGYQSNLEQSQDKKVEDTLKAKLLLQIEGIDPFTIDALVKFGTLNMDKFDKNTNNFITLLNSLKVLEDMNIGKVFKNSLFLDPLLINVAIVLTLVQKITKSVSARDMNKFNNLLSNLSITFTKLNKMEDISQKSKSIIKSLVNLDIIIGLLMASDKLIQESGNINQQNIQVLKTIFESTKTLFDAVNSIEPINNPLKKEFSFLMLDIYTKSLVDVIKKYKKEAETINTKDIYQITLIMKGISSIIDVINKMNTIDPKSRQNIARLSKLFGVSTGRQGKKTNESLNAIFDAMGQISENLPESIVFENVNASLVNISTLVKNVNDISDIVKDPEKLAENLEKYIKVIEETYQKLNERFEQIISTSETAERAKAANEKINEALKSTNEIVGETSKNKEDVKDATLSIEGISEFMITATIVMSIGALFVMMGGGKFVKAALEFGIVLAIFEGLVLMPVLTFGTVSGEAFKELKNLNSFIITCTLVMLVGALFMELGGGVLVKDALAFGITLGIFELLVVSPILLFGIFKTKVFENMNHLNSFIVTCTIVMLIGALFMELSGGKMVQRAIEFGWTLMKFEALIITPFLLFGIFGKRVSDGVKGFSGVLIICTTLMLVGALFMELSGGKMVDRAMEFGMTLMKFEALVIAPFLLFNLFRKAVFDGMKTFSGVLITCTILLLVGALFMGKAGLAEQALLFTGLLATFEALTIAPFILFNLVKKEVMNSLAQFSLVVFTCTVVLIVGAMFMQMKGGAMAIYALEFTGLLAAFEVAMVIPMLLFHGVSKPAIGGAKDFGTFVALCAFSLIIGAFFIEKFGVEPVKQFALILAAFVFGTTIAMTIFSAFGKTIITDAQTFGVFILLSSISLTIGSLFINKFGVEPALEYAILLGGFVVIMGDVMLGLSIAFKAAGGEPLVMSNMLALGFFLLLSTVAIGIGTIIIDKYGFGKPLLYAGLLVLFIGIMGVVFATLTYLSAFILPGAVVAGLMAMSLLTLSASIFIINLVFESDPKGKKIFANIETLCGVLSKLEWTYALLGILGPVIGPGALVATAIGASMIILGIAFGVINLMVGKHAKRIQQSIKDLDEILGLDYLAGTYTLLGILMPLIGAGSLSAIAIGISMLILGGSLAVVNSIIGKHGTEIQDSVDLLNKILGWDYLASTYTLLGALMVLIVPGSAAAMAMSVSLVIVTGALKLVNYIIGEEGEQITASISLLNEILGINFLGGTFALLGLLSAPIAAGSLVAMAMSIAITLLGGALRLLDIFIEPIKDTVCDDILTLIKAIGLIGLMSAELIPLAIPLGIATATALPLLGIFTAGMTAITLGIGASVLIMDKVGDLSQKTKKISQNIQSYIDIIDDVEFGGPFGVGIFKKIAKIEMVATLVQPMSETMSLIAGSIKDLASLKVPEEWDAEGKPIKYRHLTDDDFNLASNNVGRILTTMAQSFVTAWFGTGGKGLKDIAEDENGGFWKVIYFGQNVGTILSGVVDSVIKVGQAMVADPTSWDPEKGRFTKYEHIDFDKASSDLQTVIGRVLTMTAMAFVAAYNGFPGFPGLKDLINPENENSPFVQAINGITGLTQTLSNIVDSVIKIGSAQIPCEWDKDGKVIKYKEIDFDGTVNKLRNLLIGSSFSKPGILTILCTTIKAVGEEYFDDDDFLEIIDNMNKGMTSIVDTVSKSADLIIKLASMQIPTEWDKDGKAIKFSMLTPIDITMARNNISWIMTSLLTLFDPEAAPETLKKYLTNEVIDDDNIVENIEGVGKIIQATINEVNKIVKYNPDLEKLFSTKSFTQIGKDSKLTIGTLNDIYVVSNNFLTLAELLSTSKTISIENVDNIIESFENVTNLIGSIVSSSKDLLKTINVDELSKMIPKLTNLPNDISTIINTYESIYGTISTSKLNNISFKDLLKFTLSLQSVNVTTMSMLIAYSALAKQLNSIDIIGDNQKINSIITFYKDAITSLDELIQTLNSKSSINMMNLSTISIQLTYVSMTLQTMFNGMGEIYNSFYANIINFSNNINNIIGQLSISNSVLNMSMQNLKENLSTLHRIYTQDFADVKFDDENDIFKKITSDLQYYINNGINPFDLTVYSKFLNLDTSINSIYKTISNQADKSKAFRTNTNALENYVKTINKVELAKLKPLTTLVIELNKLANKLGNLDQLTDAIANELSIVLRDLVKSLEESKNTIHEAHDLQNSRHEQINKAIFQVKELMNQPLNITVKAENPDNPEDNPGGGDTPGGGGGGSITPTTPGTGGGDQGDGGKRSKGNSDKNARV